MVTDARDARARTKTKLKVGVVIPLVLGTLLVFSGSLAADSWQQDKQRQALEEDTVRIAGIIRAQSPPAPDPGDRLIEARNRLERAYNFFPGELVVGTALQSILTVASHSDVQVINLQQKTAFKQIVGEHVYYAWPFSLKVEGSLESLLILVNRLERQEGGPLVLQKVTVNKTKTAYAASLDFNYYTRSRTETVPKPQKTEKSKG